MTLGEYVGEVPQRHAPKKEFTRPKNSEIEQQLVKEGLVYTKIVGHQLTLEEFKEFARKKVLYLTPSQLNKLSWEDMCTFKLHTIVGC